PGEDAIMLAAVLCPKCQARLRTKEEPLAGKKLRCPKCQHAFGYDPPEQRQQAPPGPAEEPATATAKPSLVPWLIFGAIACIALGGLGVYFVTRPNSAEKGGQNPSPRSQQGAG